MVERTQTAGWMPSLYEPIKKASQTIADWFAPRSDAAVTQDAYEITMELPGVQPDDIDLALQDNMIIVTGEKRSEHEETGKSYFFSEREYGVFQRAFRIPPDANAQAIEADFRNGILSIKIPALKTEAGPSRKIKVRTE
jgi:HSP20 family protein